MQVKRKCRHCALTFEVARAQLRYEGYGQFCSRACHYDFRASPRNKKAKRRFTRSDGYVLVKDIKNPRGDRQGYVYEHRLVMEKHLGRCLTREEEVHHIDGDGKNNNIENLMLFPDHKSHMRHHFEQWQAAYQERLVHLQAADYEYVQSLGWSKNGGQQSPSCSAQPGSEPGTENQRPLCMEQRP